MAVETGDRGPGVVPLASAGLEAGGGVRAPCDGGGEPDAAGKDEVAPVATAQVDPAGPEVVREPDQMLSGVHDVIWNPQRAADDVGGTAREDRDRDIGPGEPIGDLVQRPVAAERDDDVVAAVSRFAPDLDRVLGRLGVDGLHLVARLERVD